MAGSISSDDIQKVREATDIIALIGERTPLKQRGTEFWGCCPFHNEKTPSFKADSSTQLWHCFGCGKGGDVFGYVMESEELTFPEAVRRLADRAHIDITENGRCGIPQGKKQRLREVCAHAAEFYHLQLMRARTPAADAARKYLSGRDLGGEIPKKWNLGFAPGNNTLFRHLSSLGYSPDEMVEANVVVASKNGKLRDRFYDRVMFPINDIGGECIAFGGRIMGDGQPKYLNSQETPIFHKSRVLYGLDKAKASMASTGTAIVAEGYTDVIALHSAGIENAVATLGTALTRDHVRQLSRHAGRRIIYLFDGDEAGQRATERALQFIDSAVTPEAGRSKLEICALTLPDNLDPAEYIAKNGADAMRGQLERARPLIAFGIDRRLCAHNLSSAEGRSNALSDVLTLLAPIKDSILAKEYCIQIAGRLRMREQDVLDELAKLSSPKRGDFDGSADNNLARNDAQASRTLPKSERNRIRMEREFLSLSTQNPLEAIQLADTLAKTNWHGTRHAAIAAAILSVLTENLGATPAEILDAAVAVEPKAAVILTSAEAREGASPGNVMAYLAAELSIGDKEEALAALKDKLADPLVSGENESEELFAKLVDLQSQFTKERMEIPSLG